MDRTIASAWTRPGSRSQSAFPSTSLSPGRRDSWTQFHCVVHIKSSPAENCFFLSCRASCDSASDAVSAVGSAVSVEEASAAFAEAPANFEEVAVVSEEATAVFDALLAVVGVAAVDVPLGVCSEAAVGAMLAVCGGRGNVAHAVLDESVLDVADFFRDAAADGARPFCFVLTVARSRP